MKIRFNLIKTVVLTVSALTITIGSSWLALVLLHPFLENYIVKIANAYPNCGIVTQLYMDHSLECYFRPIYITYERFPLQQAMLDQISDQIRASPADVNLRYRRALLCVRNVSILDRGEDLACAVSDMEFVTQNRGLPLDWALLGGLQGMTNDIRWKATIARAKSLGYHTVHPSSMCYVFAIIRDCNFRHPNLVGLVESMAELTGCNCDDFIAKLYMQTGNYEKAAERYKRFMKSTPEEATSAVHLLRGACLKFSGQSKEAMEEFKLCLTTKDADTEFETCQFLAKAALGIEPKPSLVRPPGCPGASGLETLSLQEQVLYFLLTEQYEKAAAVRGSFVDIQDPRSSVLQNRVTPDMFNRSRMALMSNTTGIKTCFVDALAFDQFNVKSPATGERPHDLNWCFMDDESPNYHLLKALAFDRLRLNEFAAAERKIAFLHIPANVRAELNLSLGTLGTGYNHQLRRLQVPGRNRVSRALMQALTVH
ncbi:MAG: hypothetical protein K2W95_09225 [Candidatus Obscuribacterales bacterium]|nr:hypothetical protein [Candidatus Obscuribacterales bacterium]